MKGEDITQVSVSGSLRSDGSEILREGALRHLGVVLLPTWIVGPDLAAGDLSPILQSYQATGFEFDDDVSIVTHRARHRSLKVKLFTEFCLQHFRARTDWEYEKDGS
jgi:DNA-binding transcriptional LysR family regulator